MNSAKNKRKMFKSHSAKMFSAYQRREAISTDVCMRVAISWDPCCSGDEIEVELDVVWSIKPKLQEICKM